MIRVVHPWSRIRMLTFSHPGSRGQKGTQSRIPDPDPQHCSYECNLTTGIQLGYRTRHLVTQASYILVGGLSVCVIDLCWWRWLNRRRRQQSSPSWRSRCSWDRPRQSQRTASGSCWPPSSNWNQVFWVNAKSEILLYQKQNNWAPTEGQENKSCYVTSSGVNSDTSGSL